MLKETGLVGAGGGGGGEKVQEDTGELGERPKAENGHRAHTGDTENRGSSDREPGSSSGKVSDNYSENVKEKRVQPPESSGPVDVLGGILSSQARTQEDRKAGPMVVETKEGKVEVGGRSFP